MLMNKQSKSKQKLVVTYGKKPRGSKTSKVVKVGNLSFFLHMSQGETRGNIYVYHFAEPYPLIACFAMSKNDTQDKVTAWIERRFDDIKTRLGNLGEYITIPKDIYKKGMK